MLFYFLVFFTINVTCRLEISPIHVQWISSQHCGYWWPGHQQPQGWVCTPGHQQPQGWVCTPGHQQPQGWVCTPGHQQPQGWVCTPGHQQPQGWVCTPGHQQPQGWVCTPGHQQPQGWVCTLAFPAVYGLRKHKYFFFLKTLDMQGPSYLGLTRSIAWLLMPWLLTSPEHQQGPMYPT